MADTRTPAPVLGTPDNTLAALVAALTAIVNECMDYPSEPRYSLDSYLPPHLLQAAQEALAGVSEQAHPAPDGVSEEQLRSTITDMDTLAQGAFSEIASMASLALLSMEQPKTYANGCGLDAVALVLTAIKGKAEDIGNCISSEAEDVGCNYLDSAQRRRWDAQRKARESAIGGRA